VFIADPAEEPLLPPTLVPEKVAEIITVVLGLLFMLPFDLDTATTTLFKEHNIVEAPLWITIHQVIVHSHLSFFLRLHTIIQLFEFIPLLFGVSICPVSYEDC
jgi:hypothetical protein